MATYSNNWYLAQVDPDSDDIIGLYEEDGVVQEYTTEAAALAKIKDLFGEENIKLLRMQDFTITVTAS